MKILRTLLYTVLVVAGIVVASVNMTPVTFVYLPPFPFLPRPEGASAEVPLALLVLAALVAGTLIAGTGTFVEHLRLRFAVRRQAKVVKGLRADLERSRREADDAKAALEARTGELAAEQARANKAAAAETEARGAAEREKARADEAERRLAPSQA